MKKLYQVSSQAVHSGTLSSRGAVDLDADNNLIARAKFAILERSAFPNWTRLALAAAPKLTTPRRRDTAALRPS